MSRFSNALLGALALHALLLAVRTRHAAPTPILDARATDEQLIEVEEPPSAEASSVAVAASDLEQAAARHGSAPGRAALRASSPTAASAESADSAGESGDRGGTTDSVAAPVASAAAPARPIDLGLDGHFFMRPPSEELPRLRKSEFQHQLEASLAAQDVSLGLARGNALLGSLNAAVRDAGPVRGEALLRVTVGPDGALSDVEFLRGAESDWSGALRSFRTLAARKRVRVPPGARGLRVTFSVKAKVQTPSGQEVPGANVAGPSLKPNGMTLHGTFDLADLGGGAQRLVYAHVVSEEVL